VFGFRLIVSSFGFQVSSFKFQGFESNLSQNVGCQVVLGYSTRRKACEDTVGEDATLTPKTDDRIPAQMPYFRC